MLPGMVLAESLDAVRRRIADACRRAGRSAAQPRLIAVTKTQDPQVLPQLAAAGQLDFGENRLDHLEAMRAAAPAGSRFHYIGRVQGRQLAKLAPVCASLHSLCEPEHIDRLGRACAERPQPLAVFLQVNTAGEGQKAGLAPEDLPAAIGRTRAWSGLDLQGLMCMAPDLRAGIEPDEVRRCFAALRELARIHQLPRLSMGMSGDFEIAIEEGATDLRIGSVLFP